MRAVHQCCFHTETDDSCTLSVVVLGDQIIRHLELGKAVVEAQFFHIRMRIGVVSKLTADCRHARDHICTVFFHIAAEHKERRLCPVLLQRIEKRAGIDAWAVIKVRATIIEPLRSGW